MKAIFVYLNLASDSQLDKFVGRLKALNVKIHGLAQCDLGPLMASDDLQDMLAIERAADKSGISSLLFTDIDRFESVGELIDAAYAKHGKTPKWIKVDATIQDISPQSDQ